MLRTVILAAAALALPGCAMFPKNGGVEEEMVWCNTRYLDALENHRPPFTGEKWPLLRISARGYPYAVAGALLLQENQPPKYSINGDIILTRLEEDEGHIKSGFRAATFETKPRNGSDPELIVTFKGTNDARDWFLHNLSLAPEQYEMARAYVKRIYNLQRPRSRIVVTGYSLGGGLASHVIQHPETSYMVDEAWLFNPSPRDGVNTKQNPHVWFAATQGEILGWLRWDYVGTPPSNRGTDFDLIRSSNVYAHSRFVLARQMLHFADLQEHLQSGRKTTTTTPLEILQGSDLSRCSAKSKQRIDNLRKSYDAQIKK